jgi:lipopolysaccharide/colanic/teichoic acid biosynthesis glycosyltransferase
LVKPGITGFSQVEVRKTVDLHARLDRDVEYVRHWSLGLDLAIIGKTPWAVLRGEGIYHEAGDTACSGRGHSSTAELPAG